MVLSRSEKETVIIFNEEGSTTNVCACNIKMRKFLAKYTSENTDYYLVKTPRRKGV